MAVGPFLPPGQQLFMMDMNAPILPPKPSHHDVSRISTPLNTPGSPARIEGAGARNPSPLSGQDPSPSDPYYKDRRAVPDPGDTWIPPAIQDLG